MNLIEITGQPCAGKTSFVLNTLLDNEVKPFTNKSFYKIYYFFLGVIFLGLKKTKILFSWSLIEDVPFYFKINIFFNAVSKFGIFSYIHKSKNNNSMKILVDEGISHLPFLFLKTDTKEVIDFITFGLRKTIVIYLSSPGHDIILNRLLNRGHKRLKFLLLNSFTNRNREIENILLSNYPRLCKKFNIIKNVKSI